MNVKNYTYERNGVAVDLGPQDGHHIIVKVDAGDLIEWTSESGLEMVANVARSGYLDLKSGQFLERYPHQKRDIEYGEAITDWTSFPGGGWRREGKFLVVRRPTGSTAIPSAFAVKGVGEIVIVKPGTEQLKIEVIGWGSLPPSSPRERVQYVEGIRDSHKVCNDGIVTVPQDGWYLYQHKGQPIRRAWFRAGNSLLDLSLLIDTIEPAREGVSETV